MFVWPFWRGLSESSTASQQGVAVHILILVVMYYQGEVIKDSVPNFDSLRTNFNEFKH